jgi:probable HAF family extracellular repeat protein
MNKLLSIVTLSLLSAVTADAACGNNSIVITNLSAGPGSSFQVNGLNATGQLTGFFSIGGSHAHAFLYSTGTVTDLQTLGGTVSQGFAINSTGQIAGDSMITADTATHGFFFNGISNIDIGALGGVFSSAVALNAGGQVIGTFLPAGASDQQGFLYANGSTAGLGTLGGTYSSPFAINNSGTVVGESSLTNGDTHAFAYHGGPLGDLGTLGGDYSSAFAVNNGGTIAGEAAVTNGDVHGFVYSGGVIGMADVGTFGGTFSTALALNDAGVAIGVATTTNASQRHAFTWSAGVLTDIGTLGGSNSFAYGINNPGQVVGEAETTSGTTHAFLWSNGAITDLNSLLSSGSGWELASARFINDAGRIVGLGTNNGIAEWFILDPATGSNAPPVAIAGSDQITDCPAAITLDGSKSFDPDGDPLGFEWTLDGTLLGTNALLTTTFPQGTNVVALKVSDPCGLSSETNVTVIVSHGSHELTVTPSVLWPPNHKLVEVKLSMAGNECSTEPVDCKIVSITSSESLAKGEIRITGDLTAKLTAWRNPHGEGRIYTITVRCTDPNGESTTSTVNVSVPKNANHK